MLRKEFLQFLPKAQLTHSSFRTGLTDSSMLPWSSLHYQLPPAACRKAQLYSHCLWWCFRVATIPGQWPWQTAPYALLPAHSSIISSSQLVPLSFYSCCPGIVRDAQYCAAATGLLRPEVDSRVLSLRLIANSKLLVTWIVFLVKWVPKSIKALLLFKVLFGKKKYYIILYYIKKKYIYIYLCLKHTFLLS